MRCSVPRTRRRRTFRVGLTASALVLCASLPATAQDAHRIWGTVHTTNGDRFEGFIRWDRNEGSWVDLLDGSKERSEDAYLSWLEAVRGGERPVRTMDLLGYRISWNEDDPDFPALTTSGIRFGHLRELTVLGRDRVGLTLRSGEALELSRGSTDIGTTMRELLVQAPGRDARELEWEELARIEFTAAPPGARAESPRLYGTVLDRHGREFTGYVAWDLDEILESDILDGYEDLDRDREVPFRDIRTIRRGAGHALVTLTSGDTLDLSGTNDVGSGNRGVQISDPALGMVEVEWDDLDELRLHDVTAPASYRDFDGGRRLFGTVVTEDEEEIRGWIRWDADEEWSWELLNGDSDDIGFAVEFGQIDRVAKGEYSGVVLTLLDGRTWELDGSNDVNVDNKGIFIRPVPEPEVAATDSTSQPDSLGTADTPSDVTDTAPAQSAVTAPSTESFEQNQEEWRYVSWYDFREVRFEWPQARASAPASGSP